VAAKRAKTRKGESNPAVSYNEFKEYEGRRYTGVKIGRSHKWHYDQGDWKETKITPDLWQISYAVTKRRAGRVPEGSGVPVGTDYHWYIVAHQNVCKIDANAYATSMAGLKFKVAHKRAGSDKWSTTPATQRKRMIRFLRDVIAQLEHPQEQPIVESTKVAAASSAAKKSSRGRKTGKTTTTAMPRSMTGPAKRRSRARKTTAGRS
jgi:hypothetical protein